MDRETETLAGEYLRAAGYDPDAVRGLTATNDASPDEQDGKGRKIWNVVLGLILICWLFFMVDTVTSFAVFFTR